MAIQFGTFDHIEVRGGKSAKQIYEERIAFLKRAEEGGFYAFHLAEHHGHELSCAPTAAVFLAALARETTRLKLIPTVVCLRCIIPFVCSRISRCWTLFRTGGSSSAWERASRRGSICNMDIRRRRRPRAGKEILQMLLTAWQTGIMSSDDSTFYDFAELKLPFDPVQRPYPPLWTAGNVETAGRGGHNFIFPTTMTPEMRARYDELRAESREQPGHQNPHVDDPWIAQCQGVVIAETDEQAEAIARRAWTAYGHTLQRMHGNVPAHLQTEMPDWDNPLAKAMMSRDPDRIRPADRRKRGAGARLLRRTGRRGIANYFMLMLPFGDMSDEEASRTLEGFIDEVIPAVREVEVAAPSA